MKRLLMAGVLLLNSSFYGLCVNAQEKKEDVAVNETGAVKDVVPVKEAVPVVDTSVIDINGEFDDYNKIIDIFFEKLKARQEDAAVDFIFSNSKWFAKDPDQTDSVKHELRKSIALIGKYFGQEKLVEKSILDRLVIVTYLVRYDRQPMQFTFKFYKPDTKWTVYSFRFDGSEPSGTLELESNVELLKIIKELQK